MMCKFEQSECLVNQKGSVQLQSSNKIIMMKYSIVFLIFIICARGISLPCANNCLTCSSGSQCLTCAAQYYASSVTGSLQCLGCGQFCLQCTSSSTCTKCLDPYVLQSNGTCLQCQISYASKCNTIVAATECQTSYYPSDNYCYSCLLNCAECTSSSDCKTCMSGYYLNSSVLTCNFCPANCLSCDQYNSTRCTSCASGYALSSSYTCDTVVCSIANCLYCQSSTVCSQCSYKYFWSSAQGTCVLGSSILCEYGAQGPYPNQCNNKCTAYSYVGSTNGTAIWCVPYTNININTSTYYQLYLYAYNNADKFISLTSTSKSLTLQSTGEYSYMLVAGDSVTVPTLPSYYRVTISIKYRCTQPVGLALSATTQQTTQSQNSSLLAYSSGAAVTSINTVYLHSNNIKILFNSTLYIVQLLIRTKKCPTNCYRCLNQDLCEMCQSPQYVSSYKCVNNCTIYYHLVTNRTCMTTCPDLFYPNNLGTNQKYCQPCQSPCFRCISADKCLSCVTGKYLLGYSCVAACPDTYYASNSSGLCQPCISPCKLCINQTSCLSCELGFWDSVQRVCTNQCPNGYYGNETSSSCQPCSSPCLTCRNTSTRCITCLSGLYYFDYQCLSQCPSRYYPIVSNLTCGSCRSPCLTCSSASSCLSCSYNYLYNNSCISVCPDGYFENVGNKSCQVCSPECKTCEMLGQCTSCTSSGCLLQGSCPSACPVGKYYTSLVYQGTANQQCSCQQCIYPCKQCSSSTQCLSCLQGYLLQSTSQCVNSCPSGFFPNITLFQCSSCPSKYSSSCLQCNSTACTRCSTGNLLHNGICLTACPSQHYVSSQHCQKCVAPCYQCISFTQCSSCISPYLYSNGSCIIQCPFGKVSYLNTTNNMLVCIACQSPCITCQNSQPTNCTMCAYGYFLYSGNNTCISNCSSIPTANTYYNQLVTSTCSKCMFPCKTCLSQTQCLTCQIGYLTSSAKCQNCPYSTYADANGVCIGCPSACSNCYTAQFCTGCKQGFYLYAYQCISNTSICLQNGYYPIGRVCQPCQMPCLHCNTTASKCTSCLSGYIFLNSTCVTECPKGMFRNGTQCQTCHTYCDTCSGTSTYCFTCKSPYVMVLSKMQCATACPNGTYLVGASCQLCQYPCLQCLSQTQCLSCVSGALINQTCLSSCPSGYYSDSTMKCRACQSPCSQCEVSPSLCKQCVSGYYLYQNQCLGACPSLYFGESEAHQCLQCLGLCNQCSSHINCTTCDTGLAFYYNTKKDYGQCVGECPMSFYRTTVTTLAATRDQCKTCLSQCLTCINDQQCVLCANNNVQYQGQCLAQCPPQMYSYNGICQACSAPCLNCTDTFTCTACMNDSFLLVGSAQCIVGEVCPVGFYRIPNTRLCNGKCPAGYYHRNDRTCNNQGCEVDQYKGADMHCYSYCPQGYISDTNYTCNKCEGDNCYIGLFYDVSPVIVRDQLVLYLKFKQDPHYLVSKPIIVLQPSFNAKITTGLQTQRLLLSDPTYTYTIRDIVIQLYPQKSIEELSLNLKFLHALASFSNPIQRPSKTVVLPGYDLYPQLPQINIGFILLGCAIIGLIKNPFMTDFGQLIYLMALINLHYPINLSSALQSASLAYLHGFVSVTQFLVTGKAKFSYVTDLGLLSNCLINLLVICAGLMIFLIVFIIYQILKRVANYNKVDQDPNSNQQSNQQNQQNQIKNKIIQQMEDRKSVKAFRCLQTHFIDDFKMGFLNRLIYFNYLPLAVFTTGQLSVLNFSAQSTMDLVASILSIILMVLLLSYPIFIFRGNKPKYSFLMLRKLILALALILSVQNATYMIGVTAVVSIMSGILVGAYGMEKWKVQTKFNSALQITQALLIIIFAVFAMIGQGSSTYARLIISWVIIFMIVSISLAYLVFSLLCFVLWGCKKFRGIDYIEYWKDNQQSVNGSESDSEINHDLGKKSKDTDDGNNFKTATVQKLLTSLSKQPAKSNQYAENKDRQIDHRNPTIANNQLFWTYNDNDEPEDQNSQKAPQMLIRCVNQFSDFDAKQNKQQQ